MFRYWPRRPCRANTRGAARRASTRRAGAGRGAPRRARARPAVPPRARTVPAPGVPGPGHDIRGLYRYCADRARAARLLQARLRRRALAAASAVRLGVRHAVRADGEAVHLDGLQVALLHESIGFSLERLHALAELGGPRGGGLGFLDCCDPFSRFFGEGGVHEGGGAPSTPGVASNCAIIS